MNWIVYHIASGHVFFSGVAFFIAAAVTSAGSTGLARRLKVFFVLIAAIAIAVSSTAIPYWSYIVASVITMFWLVSANVEGWRSWTRAAVVVAWAIACAIELPYHITPSLGAASSRSLAVIGDSITAGMGASDKSERWPTLLARKHNLDIQDLAQPGETAASALKRVKSERIVAPVVILEIGGNDLLGDTTSAEFERDLEGLLSSVSAPGRQVVMFELPLPPFRNEYGRVQRSLARKYEVALVPKRVLLSIIATEDSTVDAIHLTQAGHQRMAEAVWRLVKPAFPPMAEPEESGVSGLRPGSID